MMNDEFGVWVLSFGFRVLFFDIWVPDFQASYYYDPHFILSSSVFIFHKNKLYLVFITHFFCIPILYIISSILCASLCHLWEKITTHPNQYPFSLQSYSILACFILFSLHIFFVCYIISMLLFVNLCHLWEKITMHPNQYPFPLQSYSILALLDPVFITHFFLSLYYIHHPLCKSVSSVGKKHNASQPIPISTTIIFNRNGL
jgi:hypothetical protein